MPLTIQPSLHASLPLNLSFGPIPNQPSPLPASLTILDTTTATIPPFTSSGRSQSTVDLPCANRLRGDLEGIDLGVRIMDSDICPKVAFR